MDTPTRNLVFVHASRAAVEPVAQYYAKAAPEFRTTNLLDDGVMRQFSSGQMEPAKKRLADMIALGRDAYGAELALLTCSAVTLPVLEELRAAAGIPVLKIDEPMARMAVAAGGKIGVAVSFPPTRETTRGLLEEAAGGGGLDMVDELVPEALQALFGGDTARHDEILVAAADRLAARGARTIVLAQVSMAHLVSRLQERLGLPVFSSLETSLVAARELLGVPA